LHSAFLFGYLLGHVPFGVLADRFGGTRVLSASAVAWALLTAAHGAAAPLAAAAYVPLVATLLVLRFAIGVATAAAVPGLAAMLAQELPAERRAGAMSIAYGMLRGPGHRLPQIDAYEEIGIDECICPRNSGGHKCVRSVGEKSSGSQALSSQNVNLTYQHALSTTLFL
jgi:hypothetical protein